MVSVEVLDQLDDSILERENNRLNLVEIRQNFIVLQDSSTYLLASGDKFDHLLQCSGSMLIECNFDHLRCRIVDENSSFLVVGVLQELLTEVIAERICLLSAYMFDPHPSIQYIPVISSITCWLVSRKIMCTCSGLRSSSFFCRYRHPC